MEEYQKYAKLPLIPLMVEPPSDQGMQDSTPIIESGRNEIPRALDSP